MINLQWSLPAEMVSSSTAFLCADYDFHSKLQLVEWRRFRVEKWPVLAPGLSCLHIAFHIREQRRGPTPRREFETKPSRAQPPRICRSDGWCGWADGPG
jgi:hypothetical protein